MDTNLIFNGLKNIDYQKINVYTIDGSNKFSEVPEVKKNLKDQKNINLHTHEINNDILEFLPDIVWKCEGFVFEIGIFLRYDLARYLLPGKTNHIFVGSGADPILDSTKGPGGNHAYQRFGAKSLKSIIYHIKKSLIKGIIGDLWFKFVNDETTLRRFQRKAYSGKNKRRYNTEIEYNLKMHDILFKEFRITGIYPFINKNMYRIYYKKKDYLNTI